MKLDKTKVLTIIKAALKEDIGAGDLTTIHTVKKFKKAKAVICVNEDCIICGMDVVKWAVEAMDCSVKFKSRARDGQRVYKGKEILFLEGQARTILTVERTLLNFLCFLSGIATKVNKFAEKAKKYNVKIYDTRKTLPLLRYLEKYAVEVGGGKNHRFGLWDQVLIKENHIRTLSCNALAISGILKEIRKKIQRNTKIEIEVSNLREFENALKGNPDIIMLDNMTTDSIRKAVLLRNKTILKRKPILEVSGGINLENVEKYAKTGIDRISVGALTDSVESVDMSLEFIM